ncbi:hypothetical protein [Nitrosospira lacus]|nr:hypothetical protein [Nitrosospira lacus]
MAKHATTVNRLDTVVWGIDYPSFSLAVGSTDLDRELVANTGNYFFHRALMDVKRSLAEDMTKDSLKVLLGYFGSVCRSSLAFHGRRDDACMVTILQDRGGTAKASEAEIKSFSQNTPSAQAAMMTFNLALKEMCDAGTKIRLYINPTHASMLDAIFWAGNWDLMEAWQRSLVRMVDLNLQSGCDIRLFDFSGFNSITTEALPQVSGQKEMKNYWETSHYRSHIGTMVLKRMFVTNNNSLPSDFGIELNSEMLPAYQEQIRHDRDQYHINHPLETQLVKQLTSNST